MTMTIRSTRLRGAQSARWMRRPAKPDRRRPAASTATSQRPMSPIVAQAIVGLGRGARLPDRRPAAGGMLAIGRFGYQQQDQAEFVRRQRRAQAAGSRRTSVRQRCAAPAPATAATSISAGSAAPQRDIEARDSDGSECSRRRAAAGDDTAAAAERIADELTAAAARGDQSRDSRIGHRPAFAGAELQGRRHRLNRTAAEDAVSAVGRGAAADCMRRPASASAGSCVLRYLLALARSAAGSGPCRPDSPRRPTRVRW